MPDCILTPPTDESVITYTPLSSVQGVTQSYVLSTIQSQFSHINLSFVSQQETVSHVIDDVMRQLSFEETELDGEAGFADVAGSGVDNVGRTQEPIVAEVSTLEPIVAEVHTMEEVGTQEFTVKDVVLEDYMSFGEDVEPCNGQFNKSAPSDGQFFYEDEGIDIAYETEYDVQSSEDAGTDDDDDDDEDEDFLVEDNKIVKADVDVHLF
ncbi:hypothetical protein Tco_1062755, partial [Tanacetum coccineum]